MTRYKINGQPADMELVKGRNVARLYLLGTDMTGRVCRAACYEVPRWFAEIGGCVVTAGATIEAINNPGERLAHVYA